MHARLSFVIAVIGLGLAGCTSTQKRPPLVTVGDPELQLIQTDRDFSRLAQEIGAANAFARYTDASSIRMKPSGPMPQGSEQIRQELLLMPPGSVLAWFPREARVALSGDLGWTWGEYEFKPAAGDMSAPSHGRYVTIWHRTGDGGWRISADIGAEATPNPPGSGSN